LFDYALNFGALGTFSPLKIRSAPTFFPSLGQPVFWPNILWIIPQELLPVERKASRRRNKRYLFLEVGYSMGLFNGSEFKHFKPTNIILYLQAWPGI